MLDPRGTAQAHIPRRQGMSSFIAINVGAGGGGGVIQVASCVTVYRMFGL